MDADIYGPSIPAMLGVSGPPKVENKKMVPPEAHGIKVMSIGFLTDDDQALIWRGPILHQVLTQFVQDVEWGCLDYLVIDLPPGTGDVQISLAHLVHASAALLVTTPQDMAFRDVKRAAVMFNKVEIPVIGLVENMSYFKCPHCGKETDIFPPGSKDTLKRITGDFFVERLGTLPLEPAIATTSEEGTPIVLSQPDSETAKSFMELAGKVAQKLSIIAVNPEQAVTTGPTGRE
jgi:ATP-binding protein involved in chromosome partitioning